MAHPCHVVSRSISVRAPLRLAAFGAYGLPGTFSNTLVSHFLGFSERDLFLEKHRKILEETRFQRCLQLVRHSLPPGNRPRRQLQAAPAPGLPDEDYSVRWSGTFTPPAPGDYALGAKACGCTNCSIREAFRLYVDDQLILESQPPKGSETSRNYVAPAGPGPKGTDPTGPRRVIPLRFADRRPHTLRLKYIHRAIPTHHLIAGGIDLLWLPPISTLRDQAVLAARDADVTVAFVGISPELEGEELPIDLPGFHAGDRTSLDLPVAQESLLQALAATGKPLVVVLMTGSAINSPTARARASDPQLRRFDVAADRAFRTIFCCAGVMSLKRKS